MEGYLGERDVTVDHSHTPAEAALRFLASGQIDGEHHKLWVLDQVARCLHGAPLTVREASWKNGQTELRYSVGTCPAYERWVAEMRDGEDGPETYSYDMGSAP